jgi:hypothetical protein
MQQASENLIAEHRTLVVNEGEDNGVRAKVVAQAHLVASVVRECCGERKLCVQLLIDSNVAKQGRTRERLSIRNRKHGD